MQTHIPGVRVSTAPSLSHLDRRSPFSLGLKVWPRQTILHIYRRQAVPVSSLPLWLLLTGGLNITAPFPRVQSGLLSSRQPFVTVCWGTGRSGHYCTITMTLCMNRWPLWFLSPSPPVTACAFKTCHCRGKKILEVRKNSQGCVLFWGQRS